MTKHIYHLDEFLLYSAAESLSGTVVPYYDINNPSELSVKIDGRSSFVIGRRGEILFCVSKHSYYRDVLEETYDDKPYLKEVQDALKQTIKFIDWKLNSQNWFINIDYMDNCDPCDNATPVTTVVCPNVIQYRVFKHLIAVGHSWSDNVNAIKSYIHKIYFIEPFKFNSFFILNTLFKHTFLSVYRLFQDGDKVSKIKAVKKYANHFLNGKGYEELEQKINNKYKRNETIQKHLDEIKFCKNVIEEFTYRCGQEIKQAKDTLFSIGEQHLILNHMPIFPVGYKDGTNPVGIQPNHEGFVLKMYDSKMNPTYIKIIDRGAFTTINNQNQNALRV